MGGRSLIHCDSYSVSYTSCLPIPTRSLFFFTVDAPNLLSSRSRRQVYGSFFMVFFAALFQTAENSHFLPLYLQMSRRKILPIKSSVWLKGINTSGLYFCQFIVHNCDDKISSGRVSRMTLDVNKQINPKYYILCDTMACAS